MGENEKLNAEVIAVLPNKVKISVDDLENFQLAEEKLKVGSYLRIADNDNAVLIAIIENFNIEVGVNQSGEPNRKYILEANPLGIIRNGRFERGGDTIAIPPKKVEPAKKEEIQKIFEESLENEKSLVFQHYQQIELLKYLWMEINFLTNILLLSDQQDRENLIL